MRHEVRLHFQGLGKTTTHTFHLDTLAPQIMTMPRQGEIIHLPHYLLKRTNNIKSWYVHEVQHDLDVDRHTVILFLWSVKSVIDSQRSYRKR